MSDCRRILIIVGYYYLPAQLASFVAKFASSVSTMWKTLILVALSGHNFLKIHENVEENCAIYTDKFWEIYRLHFALTKTLTVTVLVELEQKPYMDDFIEGALKRFYTYKNFLTIIIQVKILQKRSQKAKKSTNYVFEEVATFSTVPEAPLSFRELVKIKSLYSDGTDGHVIIAWNEDTLDLFLDTESIVPKTRAAFALLLVSSDSTDCSEVKRKLGHFLMKFWFEFNIIDAISQTPCACDSNTVYSYHPFYRTTSKKWGAVTNYTFDEILGNYRLITNSIRNFNDYPIKTSLFVRRPTAITILPEQLAKSRIYGNLSRSKGFGGLDGSILGELAKHLNFDPDLVDQNGTDFGRVLRNGTVTGSLGDVAQQRALLSANGRFLINYGTSDVEFTVPYTTDSICAVAPKARMVPQWTMLFDSFDFKSWLAMLFVTILCGCFWFWLRRYNFNSKHFDTNLLKASWEIFSILMGVPVKLFPSYNNIVFLACCLFFNVIILGIIQGSFFKAFSTINFYEDLNTLEGVDQSGLPISTNLQIAEDGSELMARLQKKLTIPSVGTEPLDLVAYKRNVLTLHRKRDVELFIRIHYLNANGDPLLHVVSECFTTYFIAYIVPKGSPFLTIINEIVTRLVESGLTNKWYEDVVEGMTAEKVMTLHRDESKQKAFDLKDIQVAFYLLGIGELLGLLVFFGEYAWVKLQNHVKIGQDNI